MQTNGSSPIYASRHFWRWLALLTFVLAFVALLRYSLIAQWDQGLNFGVGRGVQIVDPSGLNRMPIWPGTAATTVNFTLYPVTPTDFVKRMATYEPSRNHRGCHLATSVSQRRLVYAPICHLSGQCRRRPLCDQS